MIIRSVILETVAGPTSRLPQNTLPEYALAGKSNVGKSSLINTMIGRRSFARTSSSPGKTQTINYYKVNNEFYLVDLPGYGYAKVSRTERERWGKLIDRYLRTSPVLKQVFLLVDIRHEPGENDRVMYDWITASGFVPAVIATKADKLSKRQQFQQLAVIRKTLGMGKDSILIPFSAKTGQGKEELSAWFSDDRAAGKEEGKEEDDGTDENKGSVQEH